ncbi:MAG TPA: hypothetical protein EYN91_06920 [Candidatus Melainabacteria bacterium]|jgi:hypothetical protein|nr:hypothetical protein [Candidatus Melainabacteria bacterium]HIN67521.1 hypothetical protein [Candidatus Obscuribacterales bacterium]
MQSLVISTLSLLFVHIITVSVCFAQGHVEANVPESQNFDSYLKRDLNEYFASGNGVKVSVEYELLRKPATQVGVAYPKFYAWVKVFENETLKRQGAVRVAAIDKEQFEITNFVTAETIRRDPKVIETVFPAVLCPKIIELAKQ